jgi:hypothetical protein
MKTSKLIAKNSQAFGFFGSKEEATKQLSKGQNNTFILKRVSCLNPKLLTWNLTKINEYLHGKTLESIEGWILEYNEHGYLTKESAKKGLMKKLFYKVNS